MRTFDQASDTFTRANEAPMAGNWTTVGGQGGLNLTTNQVVPINPAVDGGVVWTGRTWAVDQSSRAKLTVTGTGGSGQGPGLCVRASTAADTRYRFVVDHAASSNCRLTQSNAGSSVTKLVFTQAFVDGDLWELTAEGPQSRVIVKMYYLGQLVGQILDLDNLIPAAGSPGLYFSSTETSAAMDDWVGGELIGDPYQTPATFPAQKFGPF